MANAGQRHQADAFFSDRSKFPLHLSKIERDALTQRFNATFAGQAMYNKEIWRLPAGFGPGSMGPYQEEIITKDMSEVSNVPRPARTATQIRQHRHRIINVFKHFMMSYDFKKRYGVADDSDLVDDPDSDFDLEEG